MDYLFVIGFFSLLGCGYWGLRVWSGRCIDRYIAEHTPEPDYRAMKRKSRADDLKYWDYQFAALQTNHHNKRMTKN